MARHDGGCPDVGTMARALWWLWWNVLQKLDVEVLAWLVISMESWSVADSSSQVCNLFLFSLYLHIVCFLVCIKTSSSAHPSSILNPQSHYHIITSCITSTASLSTPMEASAHPQPIAPPAHHQPTRHRSSAQCRSSMLVQSHPIPQHHLMRYVLHYIYFPFPSHKCIQILYFDETGAIRRIINGRS